MSSARPRTAPSTAPASAGQLRRMLDSLDGESGS